MEGEAVVKMRAQDRRTRRRRVVERGYPKDDALLQGQLQLQDASTLGEIAVACCVWMRFDDD